MNKLILTFFLASVLLLQTATFGNFQTANAATGNRAVDVSSSSAYVCGNSNCFEWYLYYTDGSGDYITYSTFIVEINDAVSGEWFTQTATIALTTGAIKLEVPSNYSLAVLKGFPDNAPVEYVGDGDSLSVESKVIEFTTDWHNRKQKYNLGEPITIKGTATPGDKVNISVHLEGKTATDPISLHVVHADVNGNWEDTLYVDTIDHFEILVENNGDELYRNYFWTLRDTDSTVVWEKPDGTKITTNPTGTIITEYPDGKIVYDVENGGMTTQHPDGSITLTMNGRDSTYNTDGTAIKEDKWGNITFRSSDGTEITINPDDTLDEIDAKFGINSEIEEELVEADLPGLDEQPDFVFPPHQKQVFQWWADGLVSDEEAMASLKFLLEAGTIQSPHIRIVNSDVSDSDLSSVTQSSFPPHQKQVFQWWAQDLVSDEEAMASLKFLLEAGTIQSPHIQIIEEKAESVTNHPRILDWYENFFTEVKKMDIQSGSSSIFFNDNYRLDSLSSFEQFLSNSMNDDGIVNFDDLGTDAFEFYEIINNIETTYLLDVVEKVLSEKNIPDLNDNVYDTIEDIDSVIPDLKGIVGSGLVPADDAYSKELTSKIYTSTLWNLVLMNSLSIYENAKVEILNELEDQTTANYVANQNSDTQDMMIKVEDAAKQAENDAVSAVDILNAAKELSSNAESDAIAAGFSSWELEDIVSEQQKLIDKEIIDIRTTDDVANFFGLYVDKTNDALSDVASSYTPSTYDIALNNYDPIPGIDVDPTLKKILFDNPIGVGSFDKFIDGSPGAIDPFILEIGLMSLYAPNDLNLHEKMLAGYTQLEEFIENDDPNLTLEEEIHEVYPLSLISTNEDDQSTVTESNPETSFDYESFYVEESNISTNENSCDPQEHKITVMFHLTHQTAPGYTTGMPFTIKMDSPTGEQIFEEITGEGGTVSIVIENMVPGGYDFDAQVTDDNRDFYIRGVEDSIHYDVPECIITPDPVVADASLYRLVSAYDHFYTTDLAEKNNAVAYLGYVDEGVEAKIFSTQVADSVPLYRLLGGFNHFYTTDLTEKNNAIASLGYIDEGIEGYVYLTQEPGSIPLYRMVGIEHFYTTDLAEKNNAVAYLGYVDEGIECYVFPN